MKKLIPIILLILICHSDAFSQSFRGIVLDSVSLEPLIGVSILMSDLSNELIDGIATDVDGRFELTLEDRTDFTITFSYIGTHSKTFSSKEIESLANQEVTILLRSDRDLLDCELLIQAPVNHYFSTDKIDQLSINGKHRGFAASFNDPIRSLIRFPGMSVSNDQSNGIVYRGLPNEFMSWRVDGAEVVSPNHLSSAGTATDRPASNSGGVMSIPFESLDNFSFNLPNYSKAYDNAISGITNLTPVKNTASKPSFLKFGFLGLEGALSQQFDSSPGFGFHELYAQYRYSFTGLLSDLGVDLGDEEIRYQDLIFTGKIYEKEQAKLTATFNYGKSSNRLPILGLHSSDTYIAGLSFSDRFASGETKNLFSLYYSSRAYTRELLFPIVSVLDPETVRFVEDLIVDDQNKLSFHGETHVNHSEKNASAIGGNFTYNHGEVSWTFLNQITNLYTANYFGFGPKVNGNLFYGFNHSNNLFSINPEVSMAFTSEEKFIPEGRLKLGYRLADHQIGMSVSKNSRLPNHALYSLLNETTSNLNQPVFSELKTMKSVSADLSFNYLQYAGDIGQHIRINLFYQRLFDLPISANGLFEPFTGLQYLEPTALIPEGEAETYGIDILYHRALGDFINLNLNTSIFDAKYSRLNTEIVFDSPFNYGYTFNALLSHRWLLKSKTLYTNLAFHTRGGAYVPLIDTQKSVQERRSIYTTTFEKQGEAYSRLDLRMRYEFGKNHLILDIQNVLNKENLGFDYYNSEENSVKQKKQLGMIPILSYRRLFN